VISTLQLLNASLVKCITPASTLHDTVGKLAGYFSVSFSVDAMWTVVIS